MFLYKWYFPHLIVKGTDTQSLSLETEAENPLPFFLYPGKPEKHCFEKGCDRCLRALHAWASLGLPQTDGNASPMTAAWGPGSLDQHQPEGPRGLWSQPCEIGTPPTFSPTAPWEEHPCSQQARAWAPCHHTHSSQPSHRRRRHTAHRGAPLEHIALETRESRFAGPQGRLLNEATSPRSRKRNQPT